MCLVVQAWVDTLTGLGNRRAFDEALADGCVRARRGHRRSSLVCLDLDHFELINDRLGHEAGGQVLCQPAQAVHHAARAHFDRGFRPGGDESALLLPGSSVAQAEAVLARIGTHCSQCGAVWRTGPLGLSAGIVELRGLQSPADFLRRADAAMYAHKAARRHEA